MASIKRYGWHWQAFLLGPFWYINKGMTVKGTWLIILCIATFLLASPFILLYCGSKGRGDFYNFKMREKSSINVNKL